MSYEYGAHNADWMQNEALSKAHSICDEEPLSLEILSISKAIHYLLIFNGGHMTQETHSYSILHAEFFSSSDFFFVRKTYLSNHL